jgi:hypothetical protein
MTEIHNEVKDVPKSAASLQQQEAEKAGEKFCKEINEYPAQLVNGKIQGPWVTATEGNAKYDHLFSETLNARTGEMVRRIQLDVTADGGKTHEQYYAEVTGKDKSSKVYLTDQDLQLSEEVKSAGMAKVVRKLIQEHMKMSDWVNMEDCQH